jgi:hypothetical protein
MLEQVFGAGQQAGGQGAGAGASAGAHAGASDRIGRILSLIEHLRNLDAAINFIRYDNERLVEFADVLKTLGDAKDAASAELKTV